MLAKDTSEGIGCDNMSAIILKFKWLAYPKIIQLSYSKNKLTYLAYSNKLLNLG